MGTSPPGWYPDPQPGASGVRYWDGRQWTGQTAPTAPPATAAPQWHPPASVAGRTSTAPPVRFSTWLTVLLVVVSLVLVTFVGFTVFVTSSDGGGSATGISLPSGGTSTDGDPGASGISVPPDDTPYAPELESSGDPARVQYQTVRSVPATRAELPTALFAVPNGPDVATPAGARLVTSTIWDLRRQALDARAFDRFARFETGSALAVDARAGCGCGSDGHFGAATDITVSLMHDSEFPASFVAQAHSTYEGRAWNAVLVFSRQEAGDPWRLTFSGGGPASSGTPAAFPFAVDRAGFALWSPSLPLPAMLADYWQRAKDLSANTTDHFTAGPLTTDWAEQLAANPQGQINSSRGLTGYYRFFQEAGAMNYNAALADGSTLECGPVIEQEIYASPLGSSVVQPSSYGTWGPLLEPGLYRAVVLTREYSPCFVFKAPANRFTVIGHIPPDTVALSGVE